MKLLRTLAFMRKAERIYFSKGENEIARENLETMQMTGAIGSVLSIALFWLAPMIPGVKGNFAKEYYLLLPIFFGVLLFAFFYLRREKEINPISVEVACALFYTLLLAVFIVISVYAQPDTPQIFISVFFMLMPVLLIVRELMLLFFMAAGEGLFLYLAAGNKTLLAYQNDVFNTLVSILFTLVIMYLTGRLRYRNFDVRMILEKLSRTDALTGLLNKQSFEETGADFFANTDGGRNCAFFILDIDRFKAVNDEYGHLVGDALLAEVGKILSDSFRQSDLVGRIGGDEFAALLCGISDPAFLNNKCRDICERFSQIRIDGKPFSAGCSIGVAISSNFGNDYAELFRAADDALYRVKRRKKEKDYSRTVANWLFSVQS